MERKLHKPKVVFGRGTGYALLREIARVKTGVAERLSSKQRKIPRGIGVLKLPVGALVAVLMFLFSVQLLGTATEATTPLLERLFRQAVVGDTSALGVSWLATYLLTNGSVVAALSISVFESGVVSAEQLFMMVAGSRLGGSAIVVFVGALDYFQKKEYSLPSSVSMGLLTFLLTYSVYLPATVLGYLSLPLLRGRFSTDLQGFEVGIGSVRLFEPVTVTITNRLGSLPSFVFAVLLLFGSIRFFDRLLRQVETETLRRNLFRRFRRTWLSFLFGILLTGVTTSVAFSLGLIVPLYNRGFVKRDELVPYILGANIGTLADTAIVAVVLGSPVGFAVVLFLLLLASVLTVAVLFFIDDYTSSVAALNDRLLNDRRYFAVFVVSLVVVPLALLLFPLFLI
jgi:sodium-dependent phosphate cotransporter